MLPRLLLGGLVLVFTWCILPLVYSVELAGLLEDPTFSVGMISRFTRGTRVCCSVICLYVNGLESLWKFVVQHLIGET